MEEQFIEALKQALEFNGPISLDDEFRNYAVWDSLGHMSLIAMLDAEYGIQIESALFDKMKTVGDLFRYVQEKQAK